MPAPSAPQSACAAQPLEHTDAGPYGEGTRRSDTYPNGTHAGSPEACCALCAADENCVAWTAATSGEAEIDCWPFSVAQSTQSKAGRTFGRVKASLSAVKVARGGSVVYDGANTGNASTVQPNMLHWPSPLESPAYAFTDYPRFTVPEWGPTPVPKGATVPPAAVATNGYDFSNSVDGDTYIFLLGDSLDGWYEARKDFLLLTGPTPLLPDFTWGVWYTWYNSYTESRAKDEIGNWTAIKLPLDGKSERVTPLRILRVRVQSSLTQSILVRRSLGPGYELAQCRRGRRQRPPIPRLRHRLPQPDRHEPDLPKPLLRQPQPPAPARARRFERMVRMAQGEEAEDLLRACSNNHLRLRTANLLTRGCCSLAE